jgi:hydrogenase maturation factor HypE
MGTLLIAKRLDLKEGDVDGEGWNTSVPKLIDNAIIGVDHFFRRNFSKDIENATNNILSQMCNITHIQDSEKPEYKKLIEYELKKVEKEKEYVIREKEKIRQGKEWMKKIDEIYKTNPEKITELLESIRSKE